MPAERSTPGRGQRRPYAPPRIERVLLRPEEAVLTVCKVAIIGPVGPIGSLCLFGIVACEQIGS